MDRTPHTSHIEEIQFRSPISQLGFAQLNHAIALDTELSHGAFRTYHLYLMYAQQKDVCWPSRKRIAADLGMSEGSLKRYTSELVRLSYITRQRRMHQSWLTIIEDLNSIPRLEKLAKARLLARRPVADEPPEESTDKPSKGSQMGHPKGHPRPIEEEPIKDNQEKESDIIPQATLVGVDPPKPKRKSKVSAKTKRKPRVSAGSRKEQTGATVYRSLAKLNPPSCWREDLESITDLDRWRAVYKAWVGCGYKKTNVQGMFECYTENRMPTTKGAKHESRGGYKQHQKADPETVRAFAEARKRLPPGVESLRPGPRPGG